jgi:hypothetical protein
VVVRRMTGRRERASEEKDGEGEREVVRRRMGRKEGEEGERETVRKRMERKGEKGSEEDDYFNTFPPTMPSVVLENRSIRMFKVSYQSAPKKQHLCSTS